MYRSARIYVADVMTDVVAQATVFEWTQGESLVGEETRYSAMVPSVGENDNAEWLKDALIALLESL